ncbi:MAG TPA: hypothetical protein VGL89_17175 [Candidatus Koribacter sp.]
MSNVLESACPKCGAAPKQSCTRLDGTSMPIPHTGRTRAAGGHPIEDRLKIPFRKKRRTKELI